MRDYWFISDTHFGHQNIIRYCNRPYHTYLDMDQALIENWNSVVKKGDYVYHLGDFFMEGPQTEQDKSYRDYILSSLNGRITLILGNHDDVKYLMKTGRFHDIVLWKPWHNGELLFSHIPLHQDSIHKGRINVHGHTHNLGSPKGPYKSVCVELTNYTPINLEQLK